MDEKKKKSLEDAGWKVGTVEEFLDLTPEESAFIELKIGLANALKFFRDKQNVTQRALAKRIGSSQSRVAKMEAGDPSVSADLLLKSLFALGLSIDEIMRFVSEGAPQTSGATAQTRPNRGLRRQL